MNGRARHPAGASLAAVAAVVLAAGTSSRYRAADAALATKLVAELDGTPLVRRVVRAALGSRAHPVLVVTGHAEAEVRAALSGLDALFLRNPDYAQGLSTSLRAGLAALPECSTGALVLLGDMPDVSPALIDGLIAAFEGAPGVQAVVPVHQGRRGNPALLAHSLFESASALSGDEGARPLLRHANVLEVPVADDAVTLDIDDPDELRRRQVRRG